jgi:hypothetical protein
MLIVHEALSRNDAVEGWEHTRPRVFLLRMLSELRDGSESAPFGSRMDCHSCLAGTMQSKDGSTRALACFGGRLVRLRDCHSCLARGRTRQHPRRARSPVELKRGPHILVAFANPFC